MAHEAVGRVRDALEAGVIDGEDLTARALAHYLGATTSLFYHHFGSLDGFLHEVSRAAFERLEPSLEVFEGRPPVRITFEEFASNYLAFAVHQPALYELMFERSFSYEGNTSERRTGPGRVLRALVRQFSRRGSALPLLDAKAFHASLHGLASMAKQRHRDGHRAETDAVAAARRLVACMVC